jgi:hypothetical protein
MIALVSSAPPAEGAASPVRLCEQWVIRLVRSSSPLKSPDPIACHLSKVTCRAGLQQAHIAGSVGQDRYVRADAGDAATVAVGGCIDEFATVDTSSTAFRYACNLNGGTPTLPSDGLDLVRLHDVMNGIENFTHNAELAAEDFLQHAT